ncbi:ABC transporter ATP-binding protein [Microvirga arabica]|uniref:ABC transporter ATP-binding protein n=1 Tax=Microvirga arabica TaxID=1128671 RepID=A0ABV6Y765_9HYPH
MEKSNSAAKTNPRPGEPLLEINNLQVSLPDAPHVKPIIDGINLRINAGEVVALVGESGSGKSMTALSLMQLLPTGLKATSGKIIFDGEDILAMSQRQLNHLRGGRIAMLFQQPQAMLDPTSRVGTQVAEPMRIHRNVDRTAAKARVLELLGEVGIPDPSARADCFSYELSGGMAQRVMIAAALSANPELLIADEPTTALDVTVQAQILKLLDDERRKRQLAVLLITHDLSIVSALADRVAVMYSGRIVEEGPTQLILSSPQHPYTKALIQCSLLKADKDGNLFSIPGGAAQARDLDEGCRFLPRCVTAASANLQERCTHLEPALDSYNDCCKARCWAVKPDGAHSGAHEARRP